MPLLPVLRLHLDEDETARLNRLADTGQVDLMTV